MGACHSEHWQNQIKCNARFSLFLLLVLVVGRLGFHFTILQNRGYRPAQMDTWATQRGHHMDQDQKPNHNRAVAWRRGRVDKGWRPPAVKQGKFVGISAEKRKLSTAAKGQWWEPCAVLFGGKNGIPPTPFPPCAHSAGGCACGPRTIAPAVVSHIRRPFIFTTPTHQKKQLTAGARSRVTGANRWLFLWLGL